MSCTSSLVSHDALGSGDDCGAQALHDLGHIFAVGVNAQTRLGNALQAVDDRSTIFLILEGQGDNTLLAVVGDFHTLDVALINQDLADCLLQVGSRNVHGRVFGSAGVADASEQVRDRIGDLHATNLLRL